MMDNVVWISWQEHRRTTTICDELNIPLKTMLTSHRGALRYFVLAFRTIKYITTYRPRVLIVQNPSIVLSFLAVFLQFFFRYKLIVDAHNEGVEPYINSAWIFQFLTRLLHRLSDLTIVTNQGLVPIVETNGGRALILPDGLPKLAPQLEKKKEMGDPNFRMMLIATFVDDEPIEEIFEAFGRLSSKVELRVTGNYNKLSKETRNSLPEGIILCGFLPEQDYINEMYRSDLIIDLTKKGNCLVCGAYEAIVLGRPIMLSDDIAGRELFDKGVVFTKNDSLSICEALNRSMMTISKLKQEAEDMSIIYPKKWIGLAGELKKAIKR